MTTLTGPLPGPRPQPAMADLLRSRAGRRVLLLGESPGRGSVVALSLASRTGRRVRGLMPGLPFDALNLCPYRWDESVARASARSAWESLLAGREVVLLGRKVARAFRRLSPDMDVLAGAAPFSMAAPTVPRPGGGWARSMVWLVPHPSGRNRWWNHPVNRRLGELFFGLCLGRLEFNFEAALPTPGSLARSVLDILVGETAGPG